VPVGRGHKALFWILLAAYASFFAEVFAGSTLFPFADPWALLMMVPLYGLHVILLVTLIYRYGRPTLATLVFAGALFGLYETYLTKMFWRPPWEAPFTLGGIAVLTSLVLLWWHTWFSFITPLVLAEGALTASHQVRANLPTSLQRFYGSRWGWLALALFGAIFQANGSPAPGISLLSGLSTVPVLVVLTWLWERATRGRDYALADLLPGRRAFRWLAAWLAALYLFYGVAFNPERLPPIWPAQVIVWGLYALFIVLFVRALRHSRRAAPPSPIAAAFPTTQALLVAGGLFMLALPLAKASLGTANTFILLAWLSGAVFEISMLVKAWGSLRSPALPPHDAN